MNPEPTLPAGPRLKVGIDLGDPLQAVVKDEDLVRRLKIATSAEINEALESLGLAPGCIISLRYVPGVALLRVRLGRETLAYPANLALQLWRALVADEEGHENDIAEALAERITGQDERQAQAGIVFLATLSVETLKLRPERLLRQSDVDRLVEVPRVRHRGRSALQSQLLEQLVRTLLALGIRADAGEGPLLNALPRLRDPSESEDALAECLIAALRPEAVEIHVERDYLEDLLQRDVEGKIPLALATEAAAEPAQLMREGLFFELGLRIPPVFLVADDALPPQTCRVQITHLPGPLQALLPLDRVLVNSALDELQRQGIPAAPALNPVRSGEISTVPLDQAEAAQALGYTLWNPLEYLILVLVAEIRRTAGRLVDCETVEYELSQLREVFPELVRAALEYMRLPQLTRLLRALVQEGVSIRNLRTILERAVGFAAVPAPVHGRIVLEERLLVDERLGITAADGFEARLEFLRIGLGRAIAWQHVSGGALHVHFLAPEVEKELILHVAAKASGEGQALEPIQLEALRDTIRGLLEPKQPLAHPAAIVTTSALRSPLRDVLRDALPRVAVLAWEELPLDLSLVERERIELPNGW